MSNYLETAAHNLNAAVEQVIELHDTEGVDITSAQLLKIAEVAALTSIAYSLAGGKTKKSGPFKIDGITHVDARKLWAEMNEGKA